jgi:RNA polymerase sigma factor (sigma-70 family)
MSSEKWLQSAQSDGPQYVSTNGTTSVSVSSTRTSTISALSSTSKENGSRSPQKATAPEYLRESLVQMIRRLTPNATLREDLLQEAMIHLWRIETRRPGQTRSWYLQSCRFHLQHYLNCGRSIDSSKRWRDQLPLSDYSDDAPNPGEQSDSGNSIFTCVSAREIMSLLTPHLTPQEKQVLVCLAEGLGPREIGRKLNLSHTMAIRHRRKIATLLKRLELDPEETLQFEHSNGSHGTNGHAKLRKKHWST